MQKSAALLPPNGGGRARRYTAALHRRIAAWQEAAFCLLALSLAANLTGECALPAGYGFEVTDIRYSHSAQEWEVYLKTSRQYLGDVAAYTEEVAQLKAPGEETDQAQGTLNAQLAEADETVISLYEQLEGAGETAQGGEEQV